ncbi:MAG: single-stranded-DNA-specific exonuclease RecJ [Thermoleophilia bacterium]|nr:single-stranded-DNA-specific exonuclease RecJ [Thermoleophilia bacterium]
MRSSRWHTSPLPYGQARDLSEALGVSEVMATVLARRGYADPEAARRFLDGEGQLHDPYLFPEMAAVRKRLEAAVSSGEKICIHGDYDVDGITATALLLDILEDMGGQVSYYLPNRFRDGYGVNLHTVEKIAAAGKTLLITVDCGINSREELKTAARLGLDTIVIDHHRPLEDSLPPGSIISPLLCGYPFKELAGVGLAFKVAQALLGEPGMDGGNLPEPLMAQLDLVALGTIADVVPLLGENRCLVKRGLAAMARSRRPGLRALMEASRVAPLKVSAGAVGFRLAPRINAAGRMDDPGPALELLRARDKGSAAKLALRLESYNQERQKIENRMLADVQEQVNSWPEDMRNFRGYVFSSPGWHEGVIGIVASRMVDLYHRPVVMIAEGDAQGKGSGRSIPAFDLHGALADLSHLLEAFGGHSAACGLTIDREQIEDFRRGFAGYAGAALTEEDLKVRRRVDALVTGRELTLDLADELARLEPFGLGNPQADLLAPGVSLRHGRVTRNGLHLKCQMDCHGVRSSAIGFGQAFLLEQINIHPDWDVIFRLEQNDYNGSVTPQLNLRDLIPRLTEKETLSSTCEGRCDYSCPDRVQGDEFWDLLSPGSTRGSFSLDQLAGRLDDNSDGLPADLDGRLEDRRNLGSIPVQVSRLAATGQSLLLLAADVPRRRRLVLDRLPLANLGLERVLMAGSRCGLGALKKRSLELENGGPAIMLADFVTALQAGLTSCFEHVIFLDPPPHRAIFDSVAANSPEAWIHLFYCSDEVQFTGKVIEHEYSIRAPLTKVYKQLRTQKAHPLSDATERLLLSGGKYLRQPTLVARCLKVLEELGLLSVEEKEGEPILILLESGKIDLSESSTYRVAQSFYEECQKFLNKSLQIRLI